MLCLVAVGVGVLAFESRGTSSPVTTSPKVTPSRTPSGPASTVTVSPFPQLATSYAGTIQDVLSQQSTPMFLTNMKQSGGNIQGLFQGLGQVGTFKGTVSAGGKVHFTVSVYGGTETLSFDGTIKLGGDIVGSFNALDPNGNKMGESGDWDVGPRK